MGDNQLSKEVLEETLDRKLQPLIATISELQRSMEFINHKYEQMRSDLELTNKEMDKTKIENKMLKGEVLNLRNQVNNQQNVLNDMEQYSRRECLEIRGIAEDPHYEEETKDIVVKVAGLMGVEIDEQDISVSHRLPKPKHSDSPPTIIAKFVRRDVRDQFYKNRKNLKDKSTKDIDHTLPESKIFVTESLTKRNRELFNKAMAVKRSLDYRFIWTTYGKVFLRKDRDSQSKLINSVSDLDNLH